ncbi:ABC transporter permease subunit [Fictibacillus iocasae]|uniref:ABC transporter permease subunit n=1 Tax=Fictibacillus iocasae TaxID=2715437 RepID=A0ABW2NQS9_9BACL
MHKQTVWVIAQKDLKAIRKNSQVWLGMILLPVLFAVLVPFGLILAIKYAPALSPDLEKLVNTIIGGIDGSLKQELNSLPSMTHKMIFVVINYLLGSIFLMIPCLNAMMISLNSFVGEKERGTLETLLFSPVTLKELFVGKILAAFIPAMGISLLSFVLFGIVASLLTYPMFGELIFPNSNWLVLIFWLIPIITIFTILVNLLVSARAKGFQEAQQIGGIVVLPVVALFIGQATGFLIISPVTLFVIGAVLLVGNLGLLKVITKYNDRNVLFTKQI